MFDRRLLFSAITASLLVSCSDAPVPVEEDLLSVESEPNQDSQPGGLFHDFIADGKYDAAGHPQGAEVFEGAERCAPTVGKVGDQGIAASAGTSREGVLCGAATRALGDGTFALNVRALMVPDLDAKTPPDPTAPVFDIVVTNEAGETIAERTVTATDFGSAETEQDLAVNFRHRGDTAVSFEVRWAGNHDVRLSYVEIFRSTPRLVVTPASRVVDFGGEEMFEIEMQDPPSDLSFEVYCDDIDRSTVLEEMLESGDATWEDTEFRAVVKAPATQLLDGCATPSKVRVRAMSQGWARETSRVTYYGEPIPCSYTDDNPGKVRVLISGFEPFPANSDRDNSSKEAVTAYASGELPDDVSVMATVLPVEYDAAPALLTDLIERCDPDIVVGFGQGRSAVDVEQIAYNRKDTAAIAGGVPDNRGVVYGGDPIVEGGVAEHRSELPVDLIVSSLGSYGIRGGPSTDPGRYVCNNLFYAIVEATGQNDIMGGFVHLPRIPSVGEEEREQLRLTVKAVVETSIAER